MEKQIKMKVGLMSLPLHTNYGGILQAYALQEVLKEMGHTVYLIDSNNKKDETLFTNLKRYTKRVVQRFLLGKKVEIFREKRIRQEQPIVSQYTDRFIGQYFPSRVHLDNLSMGNGLRLDAIVVGSDQIWRPKYYHRITDAYLSFVKDSRILRISYAPSFGTDRWEYTDQQTVSCRALLKKFDFVSVREDSAVKLVQQYFQIEASHVLDPTMLMNKQSYLDLLEDSPPKYCGKGITYILDDTAITAEIVRKIAVEVELPFVPLNVKIGDNETSLESRIAPPVENWLKGFAEADFVVTDSFHACVFSILFNKPFVVVGNKRRGISRMSSLLKQFCLENRLVQEEVDLDHLSLLDFDWAETNEKLDDLRVQSYGFLNNALNSNLKARG